MWCAHRKPAVYRSLVRRFVTRLTEPVRQILPIVKSQRNPRTSDLAISYSAVGLSYILVGCFGALALPGSSDDSTPEPEPETESRSLTVVVQVAKALHALTFYPLMTVIYRQQFIGGVLRGCGFGKEVWQL